MVLLSVDTLSLVAMIHEPEFISRGATTGAFTVLPGAVGSRKVRHFSSWRRDWPLLLSSSAWLTSSSPAQEPFLVAFHDGFHLDLLAFNEKCRKLRLRVAQRVSQIFKGRLPSESYPY